MSQWLAGDVFHIGHSGVQAGQGSTLWNSGLLKLLQGKTHLEGGTLVLLCFHVILPSYKGVEKPRRAAKPHPVRNWEQDFNSGVSNVKVFALSPSLSIIKQPQMM